MKNILKFAKDVHFFVKNFSLIRRNIEDFQILLLEAKKEDWTYVAKIAIERKECREMMILGAEDNANYIDSMRNKTQAAVNHSIVQRGGLPSEDGFYFPFPREDGFDNEEKMTRKAYGIH